MHVSDAMEETMESKFSALASAKSSLLYRMRQTPLHTVEIIQSLKFYTYNTDIVIKVRLFQGFPVHHDGPRVLRASPYLQSAKQLLEVLYSKLYKET